MENIVIHNGVSYLFENNKSFEQMIPVICAGVEYPGLSIACEKLGLTKNTVRGRLNTNSPSYADWYYVK